MKLMTTALASIAILAGTAGTALASGPKAGNRNVIAYYPTWKAHKYTPKMIPWEKITELDYSFYAPGPDGKLHVTGGKLDGKYIDNVLIFGPEDPNGTEMCTSNIDQKGNITKQCSKHKKGAETLLTMAEKNKVKVFASIGGWTMSFNFYEVAADPKKTQTFVDECVKLVEEYGFDGIDLDWEYPGTDGNVPGLAKPRDKKNFVIFTTAIRKGLDAYEKKTGKHIPLSAAVPCSQWRLSNGYDVEGLDQNLDQWNLMSYDLHGPWEAQFGHNSPMYSKNPADRLTVSACVEMYMDEDVAPEKLNLGLPFYGRSWKAPKTPDADTWSDNGGPMYHEIVSKKDILDIKWDDVAKVPYATYGKSGELSFDDPKSIAIKARYAKEKALGGVIIWEITGDLMKDGSQPMLDSLNANLHD